MKIPSAIAQPVSGMILQKNRRDLLIKQQQIGAVIAVEIRCGDGANPGFRLNQLFR
ncbi:MAG: hypothetical protein R3C26_21915 [Calditrichia bacterium]